MFYRLKVLFRLNSLTRVLLSSSKEKIEVTASCSNTSKQRVRSEKESMPTCKFFNVQCSRSSCACPGAPMAGEPSPLPLMSAQYSDFQIAVHAPLEGNKRFTGGPRAEYSQRHIVRHIVRLLVLTCNTIGICFS